MIITLTPNPSVDQTIFIDRLEPGEVNRFVSSQLDPAGKGVNASRMVHRLGWPTIAFGFLAGETGRMVETALDEEGVPRYFVRVPGQTRINVAIVEAAVPRSTAFFGPGPEVGADHIDTLLGLLRFWLPAGRVLVLAGSLPPGVPDDFYAEAIRHAREHGLVVVLDAAGEPLRRGIEATPDLIKPNREEAEELLGRPLPTLEDVARGARELVDRGIETVVVSLGKEGAICARGDAAWHVMPPTIETRSTIGSGDSFVAGLAIALARGDDITRGLRTGAAAGAATAATPGTALGPAELVKELERRVEVVGLAGN